MVHVASNQNPEATFDPGGPTDEGSGRFEAGHVDMSADRRACIERWITATAWRFGIRDPFLLDELHANLWPKIVRGHRVFDRGKAEWQTFVLTIIRNECKTLLVKRKKRLRMMSLPEGFDILHRHKWQEDGSTLVGQRFAKLLSVLPSNVKSMLETLLVDGKKNLPRHQLNKWLEYLKPVLLAIHLNDAAVFDTQIRFLEAEWKDE